MTISSKLVSTIFVGACAISLLFSGCSGYNPPATTPTPSQSSAPRVSSAAALSNNQPVSSASKPMISSSSTINNPTTATPASGSKNENLLGKNASVTIAIDNPNINPGDTFTVNIMINTLRSSRGAQIGLKFDPSAVQCNKVTEGNYYKDWAVKNGLTTVTMPSEPAIDNSKGIVGDYGITVMGRTQAEQDSGKGIGVQGQGILCTYSMVAKSGVNKLAGFTLLDVQVTDENSELINENTVNVGNGQITIGKP